MTTPLWPGQFSILVGDDLSLRIAYGGSDLELHLGVEDALGFVGTVAAGVGTLKPWEGRPDGKLLDDLLTVAMVTADMVRIATANPIPESEVPRIREALDPAFAVALLAHDRLFKRRG